MLFCALNGFNVCHMHLLFCLTKFASKPFLVFFWLFAEKSGNILGWQTQNTC